MLTDTKCPKDRMTGSFGGAKIVDFKMKNEHLTRYCINPRLNSIQDISGLFKRFIGFGETES